MFFNNKRNLRGQWCELMLNELDWFQEQAHGHFSCLQEQAIGRFASFRALDRSFSIDVSSLHFRKRCDSVQLSDESALEMQDVCRVLKVHCTVVNVLKAVSRDTGMASKMNAALYDFLRWFCKRNPKNQVALYTTESLALFVKHLQDNVVCTFALVHGHCSFVTVPRRSSACASILWFQSPFPTPLTLFGMCCPLEYMGPYALVLPCPHFLRGRNSGEAAHKLLSIKAIPCEQRRCDEPQGISRFLPLACNAVLRGPHNPCCLINGALGGVCVWGGGGVALCYP